MRYDNEAKLNNMIEGQAVKIAALEKENSRLARKAERATRTASAWWAQLQELRDENARLLALAG